MQKIDSHVHFWKYDAVKDAWITDDMKLLQRDFFPKDIELQLHENSVDGVIAVQADQSEAETDFLIALARENSLIKGVVGWVDLQDEQVELRLQHYSEFAVVKGFRHIVQGAPAGFLKGQSFMNGVRQLKKFDFTYDVLIYENQLEEAIEFVNEFPGQKFIIDHCAKPAIKNKKVTDTIGIGWKRGMQEIAQNENVFCKLSGLVTEAAWNEWNDKDFYPYLDVVFESFGTDRLVFGSDWPVMMLSATYAKWINLLEQYLSAFSIEERRAIFAENAIKFYKI
ncbi:MAG TPA: amidohydrolase family protein [Hanamia sp.]|nr:amidohydrolase family protein [Hanamia sp.]